MQTAKDWNSLLYHDQKGRAFGSDRKSIAVDRLDMQSTWHRSSTVYKALDNIYIHLVVEILLVEGVIIHNSLYLFVSIVHRKHRLQAIMIVY